LGRYFGRYGDPDGIAARVQANLLDLLTVTRDSVVLPLPSFSLMVVEDHVGFKRKEAEYGGSWAMATFIGAIRKIHHEMQKAGVLDPEKLRERISNVVPQAS
jgi:predicted RecB family nuclease